MARHFKALSTLMHVSLYTMSNHAIDLSLYDNVYIHQTQI